MSEPSERTINTQIVEHLFRHQYGKVLALFIDKFGAQHLELIEDSIQESFLRALKSWPFKGLPENPEAWLFQVARNFMIDHFRKIKTRGTDTLDPDKEHLFSLSALPSSDEFLDSDLKDEQLKMMFACCHPELSPMDQVMLSLRLLCGFDVAEIAHALLKSKEATYKTIQRAKKKFRESQDSFNLPIGHTMKARQKVVQKMLYLLFNEGYNRTHGEELLKAELCFEAIRLGEMMNDNRHCQHDDLHALLALMYFQAARLESRIGKDGALLTLEEQDRNSWDDDLINRAWFHLGLACENGKFSNYHIEASIAKIHVSAPSYKETDWKSILDLYDFLILMTENPITQLNRLVALEKVKGHQKALSELNHLSSSKALSNSYLFYAIKGDFLLKNEDFVNAKTAFLQAQALTQSEVEKRHLQKRIESF